MVGFKASSVSSPVGAGAATTTAVVSSSSSSSSSSPSSSQLPESREALGNNKRCANTSTIVNGTAGSSSPGNVASSSSLPLSTMAGAAVTALLHAPELMPVKSFVSTALAMKLRGNGTNYLHIVNTIRTRDDMETMPRLFLALASCITTITADPDKFKDLLAAIFKYDWSGGALVQGAYASLVAHLVSAKSTFLHPTLQMLARSLAAPNTPAAGPRDEAKDGDIDNETENADEGRKKAIHETLKTVLTLVPAGLSELFPALAEAFPHRRIKGEGNVVNYAKQLLVAAEYLPGGAGGGLLNNNNNNNNNNSSNKKNGNGNGNGGTATTLRDKILGLIVERCLEIDVEIKIDDSGEAKVTSGGAADDENDCGAAAALHLHDPSAALVLSEHVYVEDPNFILHHGLADLTHTHGGDEQDGEQQQQQGGTGENAAEEVVDEMAEKLDSLMLLLFDYIDQQLANDEDGGGASRVFEGLMPTLEGPILATHRCKYVQFILFYLASRDATGRVPSMLIDRLKGRAVDDDNTPLVARQAALAYLSSYLVRARGLSVEEIVRALTYLVDAAETYLASAGPDDFMALVGEDLFKEEDKDEIGVKKEEEEDDDGAMRWEDRHMNGVNQETERGLGSSERLRHVLFYSICQAIFYVVAFHHSTLDGEDVLGIRQDAAAVGEDEKATSIIFASSTMKQQGLKTRLGRLACSPLRPLDQCLESVKREFLRLALQHHLVPMGALAGLGFEEAEEEQEVMVLACNNHNPLDSYFPFDPYLLRRSSRYVAAPDVYRYWQALHLPGASHHRADADGEREEGEGEEENEEGRSVASFSSRSSSSSSEDSTSSSDEEEEKALGEDRASYLDEEDEEDEEAGVAMSLASSTGGRGGMARAAASYWRRREAADALRETEYRRKRERTASMDFGGEEEEEEVGKGDRGLDGEEGLDGTDDGEASLGGGIDVGGAGGGVELSRHILEAATTALETAAAASVARVRKESVSSLGSW